MLKTVSTANGLVSPTFSGNVTLSTGNLIIGTSGKGIDFSSTPGGISKLLDDYEEGSWTPNVFGSSTAGTYTLSDLSAYYTKIGNQVTVWAQFGFSAASGGTDNIRIGQLPFNYKASSAVNGTLSFTNVNTTTTSPLGVSLRNTQSSSANVIFPSLLIDNSSFEQIPISGISTSSVISLNLTYTV